MKPSQSFMDSLSSVVGSRYGALMLVLVLHLVLFSFLDHHSTVRWFLDLSILALLGSSLHAISGHRWIPSFIIITGASVMLLGTAARELDFTTIFPVATLIKTFLFTVMIVVIFKDVLGRHEVDMDAVLGACCVYLLMGLAWESVYAVVEWQIPNSFALPAGSPAAAVDRGVMSIEADLMYFSLITMTTIGYGDITPVSAPARVLSALQGVVAQLFVAIIIARLVGMELANRRNSPPRSR